MKFIQSPKINGLSVFVIMKKVIFYFEK